MQEAKSSFFVSYYGTTSTVRGAHEDTRYVIRNVVKSVRPVTTILNKIFFDLRYFYELKHRSAHLLVPTNQELIYPDRLIKIYVTVK